MEERTGCNLSRVQISVYRSGSKKKKRMSHGGERYNTTETPERRRGCSACPLRGGKGGGGEGPGVSQAGRP
jgi:hypothetical protein